MAGDRTPKPFMGGLLRHRGFGTILAGQFVSQAGNSLYEIALPWFVYTATGSRVDLALAGLASSLPGLAGLFSGVFVDRVSKRSVMIAADAVRAGLALCLFALAAWRGPIALLLGAVFLLELAGTFFNPASGALIPYVVPQESIGQAMGLRQSSSAAANLVGQAGGGALMAVIGAPLLFLLDAVSFVVSSISLAFVHSAEPPRSAHSQGFRHEWSEGMRYFARSRKMLQLQLVVLLANFAFAAMVIVLTAWIKGPLHGTAVTLGLSMAAILAGMVIGGLAAAALLARFSYLQILKTALGVLALCVGSLGLVQAEWWTIAAMALSGTWIGVVNAASSAWFLDLVPAALRGRIFGMGQALGTMANPLGVIFGALLTLVGISWVFALMGMTILLAFGLMMLPVENDLRLLEDRMHEQPSPM